VTRRAKAQLRKLESAESEFMELLLPCLRECVTGRWGLFRQKYSADEVRWLRWPDADRLNSLALNIKALGEEVGRHNPVCARFLHVCSIHGPNDEGEPKWAAALLDELESADR
jgi:hypothetical protein